MQWLADLLTELGNLIKNGFEAVMSFFTDIANLGAQVGKAVASIPNFLSGLPAELLTLFISLFAIVALYKILGRD